MLIIWKPGQSEADYWQIGKPMPPLLLEPMQQELCFRANGDELTFLLSLIFSFAQPETLHEERYQAQRRENRVLLVDEPTALEFGRWSPCPPVEPAPKPDRSSTDRHNEGWSNTKAGDATS